MSNIIEEEERDIEHGLSVKIPRRVHFSGIGGAGMAPLAMLLFGFGYSVTGTDISESENIRRLRARGIEIDIPHSDRLLRDAELLVRSFAVPDDAPEVEYAREKGIPTLTRPELLGIIAAQHGMSVAVAGSHGKSTVTAMLDCIFTELGRKQTTIHGAVLSDGELMRIGDGSLFLCEACEYRRAFNHIKPTVALITNIELDHTDTYESEEDIYSAFLEFANSAELVIVGVDTPLSRRLALECSSEVITYGTEDADFSLTDFSMSERGSRFTVEGGGGRKEISLLVHGMANAQDALGAYALAATVGLDEEKVRSALADFSGIERRMQLLGHIDGRAVYYDYAHHPTEIRNTIMTLKALYGRISVLFRPHTYSRTAALFSDFVAALGLADFVTLVDIYAAREENLFGVSSKELARAIGRRAVYIESERGLSHILLSTEGAIVLMGAGDIGGIIEEVKKYKI